MDTFDRAQLLTELADGTALTIDAPRRAAQHAFAPGDILPISIRPGTARALRAA